MLKQSTSTPITDDFSHFVKVWLNKDKQNFLEFLMLNETDQALHVSHEAYQFSYENIFNKLIPDYYNSMRSNFTELIEKYEILIYVGNFDYFWAGVDSVSALFEDPGMF